MDSIKAQIIDTLNSKNIVAHIYSKSDDGFEKVWFPIILLCIGALLTLMSTVLTNYLANRRADKLAMEERIRLKNEEAAKIIQQCYERFNDIDHIASLEINTMMLAGGAEKKISEFGVIVDGIEMLFKNYSYRFDDSINQTIMEMIKAINNYRRFAFEATMRNEYLYKNNGYIQGEQLVVLRNKADEIQNLAFDSFAKWREGFSTVEAYLKSLMKGP